MSGGPRTSGGFRRVEGPVRVVASPDRTQRPPAGGAGTPAPTATPSREAVRRRNLGTLLRYVHTHGDTSRAELTQRLGLNRSTIGALTADLAAAGLITEEQPARVRRPAGRPSLVVRPCSELVHAYAFSIEVDRVRAARVGLGGVVLDSRQLPRPAGAGVVDMVGSLADFLRDMRGAVPAAGRCVGVGVAVAGTQRRADGSMRMSPHVGAPDHPVTQALRAELGTGALRAQLGAGDARVGNVAELAALAEHVRGAGMGLDNLLYLHGDATVGLGIVAGGRRVTGHGGCGGEAGHMVVNPDGRRCWCGSRGCWDTEISEHALLRRAGRAGQTGRDAVLAVVDAAVRGDRSAAGAVRQVADWLGFGVANLVNVLNPEVVLFGGTLRDIYLAGAANVRSRLNTMTLPPCREHVRLRTPVFGVDAPLLGAAELAFEHLLADPLDAAPTD